MAWEVEFLGSALQDLDEIGEYLAQYDPDAARRIVGELVEAGESLDHAAERGRMVPERKQSHIRELIVGQYRVMYLLRGQRVRIARVLRTSRDFHTAIGQALDQ